MTPGSLEIPLTCKQLIESKQYDIVLASGLIVDGGIYRHDFVAQAVIQGIMDVSLETNTPILSAILTPHHFHEHQIHTDFFSQHMIEKGKELAQACYMMLQNKENSEK